MQGVIVAFIAEFVIAFVLMSVVLGVSNTPHLARYTGLFAGALVATYITLESPLSGMSMPSQPTNGTNETNHSARINLVIVARDCCKARVAGEESAHA